MSTTVAEPKVVTLDVAPAGYVETTEEPGKAAHIVKVPEGHQHRTTPQALVLEARIFGFPVEALCGYKWVPSQNPEKFPVCEECLLIYNILRTNDKHGTGLPDA